MIQQKKNKNKEQEEDPNHTMKSEEQLLHTRKRFMLLFL